MIGVLQPEEAPTVRKSPEERRGEWQMKRDGKYLAGGVLPQTAQNSRQSEANELLLKEGHVAIAGGGGARVHG